MSDIRDQVQQFYDESGEYFSKTRQKTYGGVDATWAEIRPYLARLKDGDRVLDLGCGNGRLLTGIKAKTEYVGVDFSKTLLSEARKLHPKQAFVLGDISKPSSWKKLGRGKYDAIFCVATLHHIPETRQQLYVFKQAKKYLKGGGFIFASVWNLWQFRHAKLHLQSMGSKLSNIRWVYVPFAGTWDRFCFAFDKVYMVRLLNDAGMEVSELYYSDGEGGQTNSFRGHNLVAVAR